MKKFLFAILILAIILSTALAVWAADKPITHTYLISNDGEYVFDTVIPPTSSSRIRYKPIIAMYDSNNALCGLNIINRTHVTDRSKATSFRISATPLKTPKTIKLMLWTTDDSLTPVAQFEMVPTTVCDQDFGSIANVQLTNIESKSLTTEYTFEGIFKSPVNASYTPVIRMYDATGALCCYKEFDTLVLSANKRELKEFSISNTSTSPAKIYFTLRNDTDVAQFSTLAPEVSTEKFGVIMDVDFAKGIKLFGTDGTYNFYDFADNFILSYGSKVITNKDEAYNHLNTLRFKSYNRYADKDDKGNFTHTFTPRYDWLLFFDIGGDAARYIEAIPSSGRLYYVNASKNATGVEDSNVYKHSHFLTNYSKRMVRVSISPDGKITSMSFPDDGFFAKLTAGNAYTEVFYDKANSIFSNKISVKSDAKILYLPTKKNATESDFKALTPSELKDGNSYYVKEYTTSANKQIILITHMLSDEEVTSHNTETIKNINIALNGNGQTAPGIKNTMFDISINTQSPESNDKANYLANTAMEYVAKGLEGALANAKSGYCITKDYIKIKYASEVDSAKSAIRELQSMDTLLNTSYFSNLKNELLDTVQTDALEFLEDTFIN